MYKNIWFSEIQAYSRHSPDEDPCLGELGKRQWIKVQCSGISLNLYPCNLNFSSCIFEICGPVPAVLWTVKLLTFHWHFSYFLLVCKGTMKFPFLSGLWPCDYISFRVPLFRMIKKTGLSKCDPPCYHLLNTKKNMQLYSKRSFLLAVNEIRGKQVSFKHFI